MTFIKTALILLSMELHYTFHTDPGHGWLEVPIGDLFQVGLDVHDFSECSFRRDGRLFLEEDLDAGVFIKAAQAAGHTVTFVEENTDDDHWIRNLRRIR